MHPRETSAADPFDLPEWLGLEPVTWRTATSLGSSPHVTGTLVADTGEELGCDALAGDAAYPEPVLAERWRTAAHQAWALDEVLLLRYGGRLTLTFPGTRAVVEPVLEEVRRLAKAVGAPADRFSVTLRL
jgi:hypothetical protein